MTLSSLTPRSHKPKYAAAVTELWARLVHPEPMDTMVSTEFPGELVHPDPMHRNIMCLDRKISALIAQLDPLDLKENKDRKDTMDKPDKTGKPVLPALRVILANKVPLDRPEKMDMQVPMVNPDQPDRFTKFPVPMDHLDRPDLKDHPDKTDRLDTLVRMAIKDRLALKAMPERMDKTARPVHTEIVEWLAKQASEEDAITAQHRVPRPDIRRLQDFITRTPLKYMFRFVGLVWNKDDRKEANHVDLLSFSYESQTACVSMF